METNFSEWFSEMREHARKRPMRAPLYIVFTVYLVILYAVTSRRPFGKNIYEKDWHVLLVLDACRVDTLQEVADEYEFIENVESVWSVGSQSAEWMANTFRSDWYDEIEATTYI